MSKKTIYKGEKSEKFVLHIPEIGRFGGGTQPAEYYDKDGKKVPYEKTKWYQFKIRKAYEQKGN